MIGCCAKLDNVELLKEVGFDFIEISANDVDKVQKQNSYVWSLNNLLPRTLNLFQDAEQRRLIYEKTNAIFRTAAQNGLKYITIGSGKCRITTDKLRDDKVFHDYITFIDGLCADYEMSAGIEPLCQEETNYINTIQEAADIVLATNVRNIGITLDSYHFYKERDSFDDVQKYIGLIKHVHIADDIRHFPKTIDGNLDVFLKKLKNSGYKGNIAIEIDWRAPLEINGQIIKELKNWRF